MKSPTDGIARFLRTPEAGRLLGLSGRTLEKHRTYGTGPRYRKLGGRVVYSEEELRAWADTGLRRSTAESLSGPSAAKPGPHTSN
ncbi:helix-turn-helix transcriptional regulator [Brevundimonas vesicularis]|uniref:helix-turn-helix transcriptional regulator n=1 Tax=Brevundimonas vesicularis TaxID=41276 RepID=UPI000A03D39A|nr:helix-turn-helix domain-containing protein [Brevundimonas vesicularis]